MYIKDTITYLKQILSIICMEGQLNFEFVGNSIDVTLRNYPTPKDSKKVDGQKMPIPLWKHPDKSELQEEPPIYKKQSEKHEDLTLYKKKGNDAICGFMLSDIDEHRDLMHLQTTDDGEIDLDFVKMDLPRM